MKLCEDFICKKSWRGCIILMSWHRWFTSLLSNNKVLVSIDMLWMSMQHPVTFVIMPPNFQLGQNSQWPWRLTVSLTDCCFQTQALLVLRVLNCAGERLDGWDLSPHQRYCSYHWGLCSIAISAISVQSSLGWRGVTALRDAYNRWTCCSFCLSSTTNRLPGLKY